jgi:hypothetical protein
MATATQWGTVISAPDSAGFGTVLLGDETRWVYFHPAYYASPWPVPEAGDGVAVDVTPAQGREMHAIAVIGKGTPTYVYVPEEA